MQFSRFLSRFFKSSSDGDITTKSPPAILPLPDRSLGMTDFLNSHVDGTEFRYASVGAAPEKSSEVMQRLGTGRQKFKTDIITIDNLPVQTLTKDITEYKLGKYMRHAVFLKNWIHIKEIRAYITMAQGQRSTASTVTMSLMDYRFIEVDEQCVRSIVGGSNFDGEGYMSLDYRFHKDNMDDVTFRIERKNAVLNKGVAWGSIELHLVLSHSESGKQMNLGPTKARVGVTSTSLAQHKFNPLHTDIRVTQENLDMLRDLYARGELADYSKAEGQQAIVLEKKALGSEFGGASDYSDRPVEDPGYARALNDSLKAMQEMRLEIERLRLMAGPSNLSSQPMSISPPTSFSPSSTQFPLFPLASPRNQISPSFVREAATESESEADQQTLSNTLANSKGKAKEINAVDDKDSDVHSVVSETVGVIPPDIPAPSPSIPSILKSANSSAAATPAIRSTVRISPPRIY